MGGVLFFFRRRGRRKCLNPLSIVPFCVRHESVPKFTWRSPARKSPCRALRTSRDEMGDGSAPRSLSRAGIRRPFGCQLPDAILRGKRSLRPRSRAVQRLAVTGLLSEAFQLALAGGCATGLRTRSRHVCDFGSASSPLSAGAATTLGSALTPCHGSRLLTLRSPFAHSPAAPFLASPVFGRFSRVLPEPRVLPGSNAPFVAPFGVFRWACYKSFEAAGFIRSVLVRSSNRIPSG